MDTREATGVGGTTTTGGGIRQKVAAPADGYAKVRQPLGSLDANRAPSLNHTENKKRSSPDDKGCGNHRVVVARRSGSSSIVLLGADASTPGADVSGAGVMGGTAGGIGALGASVSSTLESGTFESPLFPRSRRFAVGALGGWGTNAVPASAAEQEGVRGTSTADEDADMKAAIAASLVESARGGGGETSSTADEDADLQAAITASMITNLGGGGGVQQTWPFAAAKDDAERAAVIAVRPMPRTPGLRNHGNTCYLNSALQVLCGLDEFTTDTEAAPLAEGNFAPGSVYNAVRRLVAARRSSHERACAAKTAGAGAGSTFNAASSASSSGTMTPNLNAPGPSAVLSPAEVKTAVQHRHAHFVDNQQHDAHEFLCECLDTLEEEVTAAYDGGRLVEKRIPGPETSGIIDKIVPLHRTLCPTRRNFTTAVAATFTCEACGDECTRHETFRHLSVALPEDGGTSTDLAALLTGFFAPEALERKCEKGGCDGTRAVLTRKIVRLPRVLVVHLKRFRYVDQTGGTKAIGGGGDTNDENAGVNKQPPAPFTMRMVKVTRPVQLPKKLTLEAFVRGEEDAGGETDASLRGPPPRSTNLPAAAVTEPPSASTTAVPAKARSALAPMDAATTPAVPRRLNLEHEDDSKGAHGSSNPTPRGPSPTNVNLLGGGKVSRIAADASVAVNDGASHRVSDSDGANDEATAAVRVYPDDASPSGEDAKALAGGYELRGVVSHVGSSLEFGHYLAHVRGPTVGGGVGWSTFDDDVVDEVEEGRVLGDRTGCYVAVYALGNLAAEDATHLEELTHVAEPERVHLDVAMAPTSGGATAGSAFSSTPSPADDPVAGVGTGVDALGSSDVNVQPIPTDINHLDPFSGSIPDLDAVAPGVVAPAAGAKAGEVAPGTGITLEMLQMHFSKHLKEAAKDLGVGSTALRRICRHYGISRWPKLRGPAISAAPGPAIPAASPAPTIPAAAPAPAPTGTKNSKTKKTKTPARKAEVKSKAAAKAVDCAVASRVIDGSRLVEKCVNIEDIEDEGLKNAFAAYLAHNDVGLRRKLPYLRYSVVQRNFFLAKTCRGICLLDYPPSSECGPRTNLALDVYKRATQKDPGGRIIFKLKSRCILLHTYAVARWLLEVKDMYGFTDFRISGEGDASDGGTVRVNNRSAVALDFDQFECFPTFDDNKVKIREELVKAHGKPVADEFMHEAARLYAALAVARQTQVFKATKVKPPLFLWNAGKVDTDSEYGGALVDVLKELHIQGDAGTVFSSHHPSFLVRGSPLAKLSARQADDAACAFAKCVVDASTVMSPVAPVGSTAPADASGTSIATNIIAPPPPPPSTVMSPVAPVGSTAPADASGTSIATNIIAPPPPPPSTALAQREAGFWEGFLGVTTEEDREQARQDMLDYMDSMREKWLGMIAAVELVERLEQEGVEPTVEEIAAADAARLSVQKWRAGSKKWWRAGSKKHADSIAAVKVCESLKRKGLEPSAPQAAAAAEALPSVQRQRDGSANGKRGRGRKNGRAMSTEEVLAKSAEFNARKKAKAPETRGIHVQPSGTYRVKLANLTLGNYDTEEEAARVYTIACMTRSSPDPLATEAEEIVKMRALIAHKVTARDNRAR